MNKKDIVCFVAVFALLIIGRLAIAGTGYLEDIDEYLYFWIHLHFAQFWHPATWVQAMNDMHGQPPEILIRSLEYASTLPIAKLLGKQPLHPDVLNVIGIYNILVSMLILYAFYKIVLKLGFCFELSLTGVALLGTLFNFNIYTRHILPYDHALLFQLLALSLLLRREVGICTILSAGLLSAIGLTNYLGCFMFIFINSGYLILSNYKKPLIALRNAVLFILPFILLVSFYELITRLNDNSYINLIMGYSKTVTGEGSYDEGILYLFLYFYFVEKWWGIILLALFLAGTYLIFRKSESRDVKLLISISIATYLLYGIYVFVFRKMVFEGRVLHIYYPFVILGVLGFLQQQKWIRTSIVALCAVILAFINYGFVIKDFRGIGYPRNAIYKYHLYEEKGKVNFICYEEMACPIRYFYRRTQLGIDSTGPGILPAGKYALINLGFMSHDPDSSIHVYPIYPISEKDSVVFEQLHFQSHPAYTLEYCSRYGRNIFLNRPLKIRVVKIKSY